jgi:hypothetical protein
MPLAVPSTPGSREGEALAKFPRWRRAGYAAGAVQWLGRRLVNLVIGGFALLGVCEELGAALDALRPPAPGTDTEPTPGAPALPSATPPRSAATRGAVARRHPEPAGAGLTPANASLAPVAPLPSATAVTLPSPRNASVAWCAAGPQG